MCFLLYPLSSHCNYHFIFCFFFSSFRTLNENSLVSLQPELFSQNKVLNVLFVIFVFFMYDIHILRTFQRLDSNEIQYLPDSLFSELRVLSTLVVFSFVSLSVLFKTHSRNMSRNSIGEIPPHLFDGNAALSDLFVLYSLFLRLFISFHIYLNNNDISSIPDGVFSRLHALNDLFVFITFKKTLFLILLQRSQLEFSGLY